MYVHVEFSHPQKVHCFASTTVVERRPLFFLSVFICLLRRCVLGNLRHGTIMLDHHNATNIRKINMNVLNIMHSATWWRNAISPKQRLPDGHIKTANIPTIRLTWVGFFFGKMFRLIYFNESQVDASNRTPDELIKCCKTCLCV